MNPADWEEIKLLADEICERYQNEERFRFACACGVVVGVVMGLRAKGIGELKEGHELMSSLIYGVAMNTLDEKRN